MPESPRPRVPLAVKVANRFASPREDARLINGFIEQGQDEGVYVYQRPGLAVAIEHAGMGFGVYNWNDDIFAVFGDTLYKNGASVGTVDDTGGVYTWSSTLGSTPKLFLQNGVAAYTYDDGGGLVEESYNATIAVTADTHSNGTIDNITPDTTGMSANASVSGPGIPAGSYIVSVDSASQVTINVSATATASGVALVVQTQGFPAVFVKGSAYLDSTTYVMTPEAVIYGSELNDPTSWNSLNKIIAQVEPDLGVFVAKQLVYVIAFKTGSVEAFYDAANAVGSPLGPVQGAKVSLGCWSGDSVQQIEGVLLWVSQTRPGGGLGVQAMEGMKVHQVSTPPVERRLETASPLGVHSWSFRLGGHKFYGITVTEPEGFTLVYDLTTGFWFEWTAEDGSYWPIVAASQVNVQQALVQHATDGNLYTCELENTTDDGAVIAFDLYTPSYDGGTRMRKFLNRIDFIADQISGCVLQVRVNDWDYDPTRWTSFRTVDLGTMRPNLKDCGTFRRRIWHLRKRTASKIRLEALELDIMLGTL